MKKLLIVILMMLPVVLSNNCLASELDMKVPLPGKSAANAKLQYDTLMPVYMSVSTKAKNCQKMSVTDTKVTITPYDLKFENGKSVGGKWEELWTVNACRHEYNVPIKFVLDPTGATYIISPNKIQKKDN